MSEWLVEQIDPRPGQTILELAAGPGETGFLAAERIGDARDLADFFRLGRLAEAWIAPPAREYESQVRAMSLQHSQRTLAGRVDRSRCEAPGAR